MFQISDLPNNDALMLLVVQRHDTLTNAVAFKSHVFASLLNAQVAVIDAYKGKARGQAVIMSRPEEGWRKWTKTGKGDPPANETLRFNGVVAIRPGAWTVALLDAGGREVERQDLVALNRESYVVMRTGVEDQHGLPWAQEITVYPIEDIKALSQDGSGDKVRGGAAELRPAQTSVLLVAMATVLAGLNAYYGN
jgi:hypothetical protein